MTVILTYASVQGPSFMCDSHTVVWVGLMLLWSLVAVLVASGALVSRAVGCRWNNGVFCFEDYSSRDELFSKYSGYVLSHVGWLCITAEARSLVILPSELMSRI
jgi:hypothetical protein